MIKIISVLEFLGQCNYWNSGLLPQTELIYFWQMKACLSLVAVLCPAGFSLWLAGLAWLIYLNFPGYRAPKSLSVCSPCVSSVHGSYYAQWTVKTTQRLNEWMDKCTNLTLPRGRTTKTHQRNPLTRAGSQKPLWKQQWQGLVHPEKVTGSKDRRHMAFKEKRGISCDFQQATVS